MRTKKRNRFLAGFLAVLAYLGWDAGQRFSSSRGQVGWGYSSQDPNDINTPMEREEITRKAQHYERNNAIVNRLIDVFEQYTVGAGGMPVIPASSDEEWNKKRKELWEIWSKYPDLTSLQDFGTLQGLIARRWFVDGEIFIYKTRSDRAPYRARIQLIEALRVKTPPQEEDVSRRIYDGVEVDAKGRPIAYWVCDHSSGSSLFGDYQEQSFTRIDAKDIIHVHEPMRPGEYRSFSFFASVLNDIQDLDELCKMAMQKAKDAASITNVFKTESGELDPESDTMRQLRLSQVTESATGVSYEKDRIDRAIQVLGPRTISTKTTEAVEQLRAESPNEFEQAHWDIKTNRICAGVGISKIFVFPNSMQGTVVRADLDISTTFFRSRSSVIASAIRDIYEYVTEEDSKIERSIADKPHDWRVCSIRPPRAPNVDVGRNSSAMLAELEAGATNYRAIYSPLGDDWRDEIRERAIEEAFIDKVAAETGISPDRIRKSIGESLKANMENENLRRQEEDKVAA